MTFTNNMLTTLYGATSHPDPLEAALQCDDDDYHYDISNDNEACRCANAGADMDDDDAAVFDSDESESESEPASASSASASQSQSLECLNDHTTSHTYPASHAQSGAPGMHVRQTTEPASIPTRAFFTTTIASPPSSQPASSTSQPTSTSSSTSSHPTSNSSSSSSPPTSLPAPSPAPPSSAPSLPEAAHAIRKKPRSYSLRDDFIHAAPAAQAALERFQCHNPNHQRPKSQAQAQTQAQAEEEGAQSNDSEQMFTTHCQCSVSAPALGATLSGHSLPHRGAHSWPNSAHW